MQSRIGWTLVVGLLLGFSATAGAQQLGGAQTRPGMGATGMGTPGMGLPGMGMQGGMDRRPVPGMADQPDAGRTPAPQQRTRQGNQPQQRQGRNGTDG
jgi:hypothetical protein